MGRPKVYRHPQVCTHKDGRIGMSTVRRKRMLIFCWNGNLKTTLGYARTFGCTECRNGTVLWAVDRRAAHEIRTQFVRWDVCPAVPEGSDVRGHALGPRRKKWRHGSHWKRTNQRRFSPAVRIVHESFKYSQSYSGLRASSKGPTVAGLKSSDLLTFRFSLH